MITLVLPWPDHHLSSNGRGDRRGLTALRRQAREAGYLAALEAERIPNAELELTLEFYAPDRRRRDLLNLAEDMKSVIDGIFQANELDDCLIRRVVLVSGTPCKDGQVIIRISEK